ncbi:MAG: hypothetical protein LBV12_09455, partial [Puniceicoccales bacterium]|nr:hypothetical protein [Puniceicoccales bacterium]
MNTKPESTTTSFAARVLPWLWVPTLYLFEGIPNNIVEKIGQILLQDLNVDKDTALRLVGLAAMPWAFKPFWSPLIDLYKTKRFWIWSLQALISLCIFLIAALVFGGVAPVSLIPVLFLIAIFSATHDIAADGFYMHGLSSERQSYFIGIRNTSYRFGVILCQGALVGIVGLLAKHGGLSIKAAWALVLASAALPLL